MVSHFLTAGQAGALLGLTADAVRRLIRTGVIQAEQLGNQWVIRPAQVEAARERRKRGRPRKPSPSLPQAFPKLSPISD